MEKRILLEIWQLHEQGVSNREIARRLGLGRNTIRKNLNPALAAMWKRKPKVSKLDPWSSQMETLLEQDPKVSATVIHQRLRQLGFEGQYTIVREYVCQKKAGLSRKEAFLRFETAPGEHFQIDWGYFDALSYGEVKRKLYAMTVIDCYSRKLYVEFTHSQDQETLHQSLKNAFIYFGGTPKIIVFDNMKTAVIEREGRLIRFNTDFLEFLRNFQITPKACDVRQPQQKGKVERSIGYLRKNFWPLRSFSNVEDVQQQALVWLEEVANVRKHATTNQRPVDRFDPTHLRPLPPILPDYRTTRSALVHKDFAIIFDGNAYSVPPWLVGRTLTLKADQRQITLYDEEKPITVHSRCWQKKQRIELLAHREQIKKFQPQLFESAPVALFASLSATCQQFLEGLIQARQPLKKNVVHLLKLKEEYGLASLIIALEKAMTYHAYGAGYVENILYQHMRPQSSHPPVVLQQEQLNHIELNPPSLAEYDTEVLERKKHD